MYRLIKLKPSRSNSLTRLSVNVDTNLPQKSCLFCKILQNYSQVPYHRYQSTVANPNRLLIKRVRRKRTKFLSELLEVSDNSTSQSTPQIHAVNVKDINKILQQRLEPNSFIIEKFTNVTPQLEHTYNNLNIINHLNNEENYLNLPENDQRIITMLGFAGLFRLPNVKPNTEETDEIHKDEEEFSSVPGNFKYDTTSDIFDVTIPKINSSFHPETIEETVEIQEEDKETFEEQIIAKDKEIKLKSRKVQARREMIQRTLAGYVEVCAVQNLPYRSINAYNFFSNPHYRKCTTNIDDIQVYNALLKCFTIKANIKKLNEILKMMDKNNVKYNIRSYIIILDCFGRISNKTSRIIDQLNEICKDAIIKGFTFDKIMNEGTFLNEERENVLNAMNIYDSNYKPTYKPPIVQYNNILVNDLNHKDQLNNPEFRINTKPGLFTSEELKGRIQKQIDMEKNISITIKSVEAKEKVSDEVLIYRKHLEELYENWRESALKAYNRDLWSLSSKRGSTNSDIYLKSIPTEDIITIIVEEAIKLSQGSETYSPIVSNLYRELGRKFYNRYKALRKKQTGVLDKVLSIHEKYCDYYANSHEELDVLPTFVDNLNVRQKWQWMEYNLKPIGSTLNLDHNEWVPPVMAEIGKFLYHIIMHDLTIDVNCLKSNSTTKKYMPAFYTIFRYHGRISKEEVKPHPNLSKLYRESIPETLTFPVNEVPMLCPPIPWTSVHNGGFLMTPCEIVRLPSSATSQKQKMFSANVQNLYPTLDSLNQLSSVPWKVNNRILDLILEVFNEGGSDKLDVPEHPSMLPPPELPAPIQEMDKSQRYQFFKQKIQHRRKKAEMYSLRCDCLYRLSLANHFRNEIFWLPHNIDFRGRVYPVPPHLNHLGSDLARSMLIFAEPRPLGPKGLDWLKIHLINLTGLKKRDKIDDRLKFADECLDLIFDSADNPLDGKKWWAESDEPWQTLACCMEITDAIRSNDPENFKSHFPVHQDGSCNGLQHYAALGRDQAGGFSVNLCPTDVPQDVYSAVVALVEKRREKDAKDGLEIAKLLEGFVKRKVIKQTIMTTVYGVTRFGARLQIAKQLKDIEDFPKDQVFAASNYLTTKTFESLRTMFTSTKEIQDWFTECARLISAVAGHHVEWVTPLGLPVVQPYFRYSTKSSNSVYEPYIIDKYEQPNVMKQKNAFPPNFIHSLDSTHMMLTSLNCERAGIIFVSVHDCYWTHASTVHIMNKICRDQFVALHSQPILEDLSLYLSENYSYGEKDLANDGSIMDLTKKKLNRVLGQLPKTGSLDIKQVLDSTYFFS